MPVIAMTIFKATEERRFALRTGAGVDDFAAGAFRVLVSTATRWTVESAGRFV
jgi:hypothetical protein